VFEVLKECGTMNKILVQLGYAPTDCVAILHADDVCMYQASLDSFADLEWHGTHECEYKGPVGGESAIRVYDVNPDALF
jgi:hypothetical protein